MKKNVASQVVGAQMVTAADGTAFTGSVTVSVTVDGGTQATGSVGSGACTHEGNGYHTYAPAQAETNGDLVAFTFTGTGAVPQTVQIYTTPATGILAPATAGRTLVVDANGLADANMVKMGPTGSGTAQTARDIGASVLLSSGTGTGQILLSNGKVDAYAINGETQTAVDIGGALVQLIPQFGNAVGSDGNTTTTIHLSGIATYDNDEIVDHLLIIFDGSTGESHSRWITAFNGTTDVATVATLPFTPQATVDLWTLTNIRRNTKPESLGTQAKADVNAEADTALSDYGPSTHSAADVWSVGTRTITAATNITSTGGTITVSSGGVTLADGAQGGSSMVLTAQKVIVASSGNDDAVSITGSGDGRGLFIKGGATAAGVKLEGGSTSGEGLHVTTSGNDYAVALQGGGNRAGLLVSATSTDAVVMNGGGTGAGLHVIGGSTGQGVTIEAGSTSGIGVSIATTSGVGLSIGSDGGNNSVELRSGGGTGTLEGNITGDITGSLSDKTGFKLASDGLDQISAATPNGVASTFATKMMQLWARFFGRVVRDSDEITTYRSDGTTVATTQTYTASGSDEDVGAAS